MSIAMSEDRSSTMTDREGVTDFMARGRTAILLAIARQGPSTAADLPRCWPLARVLVRVLLEDLQNEGLVTSGPGGPRHAARLTPRGVLEVAGIRGEVATACGSPPGARRAA
jgi:hypothetical protein